EFVEEPFDEIALFIELPIAAVWAAAIAARGDDWHGTGLKDGVVEVLGIVGSVGNDGTAGMPRNQRCAKQDFATMAGARDERDRIAEAVGRRMQLGP
ncbi:MAG: hypothetical protein AAFW98_15485, partial [Pseudomonadota bacterium]